jgi:hypothetical protein
MTRNELEDRYDSVQLAEGLRRIGERMKDQLNSPDAAYNFKLELKLKTDYTNLVNHVYEELVVRRIGAAELADAFLQIAEKLRRYGLGE